MKRALAERAKQSLQQHNNKSETSTAATPGVVHHANTMTANKPFEHRTLPRPSASSSSPTTNINSSVANTTSPNDPNPTTKTPQPVVAVSSNEDSTSVLPKDSNFPPIDERPIKIPRVEKHPLSITAPTPYHHSSSTPTPAVPVVVHPPPPKMEQPQPSSSSRPLPTTKRRMSSLGEPSSPRKRKYEDTEDTAADNDNDANSSSFYLKHQNRALATELRDWKFQCTQLITERDARRHHSRQAFRYLQQWKLSWQALEQQQQLHGTSTLRKTSTDPEIPSTSSSMPMEGGEQQQHRQDVHPNNDNTTTRSTNAPLFLPASTGSGDSVEWSRALHQALLEIGNVSASLDDNDQDWIVYMEQATANMVARIQTLSEWLTNIQIQQQQQQQHGITRLESNSTTNTATMSLQNDLAALKIRCAEFEQQVTELVQSREQSQARERRLRRNVFRMAAGIATPDQVVHALESNDDDDIEASVQLEKQQHLLAAATTSGANLSATTTTTTNSNQDNDDDKHLISSAVVVEYQFKIQNLETSLSNAEKAIQELNAQLLEKEKRINVLSQRQLTEEDSLKLESYETIFLQQKMVQKNLDEMREKLAKTEERWAQSLGNEKAAVTAVEELIAKFNKRWAEVANQNGMATSTSMTSATEDDSVQAGSVDDEKIIASLPEDPQIVQAREIAELEHKLSQALENVRQSETTKDNLKVALEMNQTLQSKLEEIKTKYAALQEAKSGSTSHHSATDRTTKNEQVDGQVSGAPSSSSREKEGTTADADHHKPFTEGSGSGSRERSVEKTEKLAMQFRRAKKELLAAQASKDRAKALLERAERERQSMMESNVRLISQIAEKDEMNAKSLSTILHLKSLTEKLSAEKEILEQQAKSSSQLALAARLATNAKERVSEELMKEKQTLEEQFSELEKQYMSTKTELEKIFAEWSEASGKMKTKESALANALQRCEELAAENEQKREEIRKLVDILSKTEKEATDAKERLSDAIKSGAAMGGDSTSGAYVDQLKTQVSVLKSRLACPVCHYRDKECIILRCRHMHCKQCVEERISNRSRKCPTCNVKFSENDVGDIWLN